MEKVRVIEVKESAFANNEQEASKLREYLKRKNTLMINLMSSPGSGKTTTLIRLINDLKDKLKIAMMDVDIETDIDAARVKNNTGVESIQIHNSGLCHIDALMCKEAIEQVNVDDIDLLILENIGNLVCPAEFDTGAHTNIMILSVPEGDDKPLKYPLMFSICDIIIINKIDTLPIFDFNIERCKKYILDLNPNAKIISLSAKTGEGMKELEDLIIDEIHSFKGRN